MDQFGVLVESIGFKAHGKSSAPLADLKNTNKSNDGVPRDIGINSNNNHSINVDHLDGIFRSNKNNPNSNFDDVFGGFDSGISKNDAIDLDSVFNVSNSNSYNDDFNDDVFGFKNTSSGTTSVDHYDVLGNKVSPVKKTSLNSNSIDDLLGNFGGMDVKSSNSGRMQANTSNYDDLLGSFSGNGMKFNGLKTTSVKKQETASESGDLLSGSGVKTSSSNGRKAGAIPSPPSAKSFSASAEDPFVMFESVQGSSKPNNGTSGVDDYLDSFFSSGRRPSTRQNQSPTTEDSVYDALFNNNVVPKQETKAPFQSSHNTKKASSNANKTDDFSYLFGMGDAPPSGEFQEIKGESEDRRKARYNNHITTRERMIKALNEKNNRDLQAQREQDEKHRVGATLDGDIKRWAVGKEGNLRALLSSLQQVLWPGSGWQPISLTDLITSTAVKKAYYKATLFVHPDKVQQKGANVQQKYIAEKVFDLLKEAWNKFNAEEFKKQ